jgi:hypothetical protein
MLKGNTTASKIPRSMGCSCDTNFKFMVIQHTKETNNCATAWDFHVPEQNYDAGENEENFY